MILMMIFLTIRDLTVRTPISFVFAHPVSFMYGINLLNYGDGVWNFFNIWWYTVNKKNKKRNRGSKNDGKVSVHKTMSENKSTKDGRGGWATDSINVLVIDF